MATFHEREKDNSEGENNTPESGAKSHEKLFPSLFVCLFSLFWPHLQHIEVTGLGVESKMEQQLLDPQPTAPEQELQELFPSL